MNNIDHNATILSIIKSYVGDSNKRTQTEIADECIARGGVNISERTTRKILRYLIDEEEAPIISTNRGGYSWYDNDEEMLRCYRELRKKGISILIRARHMKRNCLAEKARQRQWEQLSLGLVG